MGKDDGQVDIAELAEQAKIIAKATGRSEEDVMEDLLDDCLLYTSPSPRDRG